ncbi:MAG: MbnP family protein, partial [Bacteroidota bacterium]
MKRLFLLAFLAFGLISLQSCSDKEGCMDPLADNYDPDANVAGPCEYPDPTIVGCMDADAINFNAEAEEAGTCEYAKLNLQFIPKVGNEDFAFNTYYDINGVKVSFSRAQFYVSRITLEGEGEASTYGTETYNVVKPGTSDYDGGQLKAGK